MKLITALLCVLLPIVLAEWVIVDNDFTTIAMSNAFTQADDGWVVGSSASLQPQMLHTTDGGTTFDNVGLADSSVGAFFSVGLTSDAKTGIAGGFGFFGLPCGAVMTDGKTWNVTHAGREIVCALTDADAISSKDLVMTGAWAELLDFNGNGCQVSTDGGKNWKSHNWNQGTYSVAKYAWFQDINTGYVSGGAFPSTDSSEEFRQISKHIRVHSNGKYSFTNNQADADPVGYIGTIAAASNKAKDFKTLVNLTNEGLYFNEIDCVDANTCWCAAEGINKTTGEPWAWIYHTTDGWSSYDIQASVPDASIIAVSMLNSTFGWAGGAIIEPSVSGAFWLTTDGSTWTQTSDSLRNFMATDISTTDEGHAYASGLMTIGLSSFARYQS